MAAYPKVWVYSLLAVALGACLSVAGATEAGKAAADTHERHCHAESVQASPLPAWTGSELYHAMADRDVEYAETLIERGEAVDIRDNHGNTPLLLAVKPRVDDMISGSPREARRRAERDQQEQLVFMKMLLEHGADPNLKDRNGNTPLIQAAGFGYPSAHAIALLTLLVEHHADVNQQSENGLSALMEVSRRGDPEVVRFLLDKGADPALADCEGRTAGDIARTYGHTDVVRILNQL
jgi:ankyrin repeat protein